MISSWSFTRFHNPLHAYLPGKVKAQKVSEIRPSFFFLSNLSQLMINLTSSQKVSMLEKKILYDQNSCIISKLLRKSISATSFLKCVSLAKVPGQLHLEKQNAFWENEVVIPNESKLCNFSKLFQNLYFWHIFGKNHLRILLIDFLTH